MLERIRGWGDIAREGGFVLALETGYPLSVADFARSALHERLGVTMRLIDMCFFQAEHDDYHLARTQTLLRSFTRLERASPS